MIMIIALGILVGFLLILAVGVFFLALGFLFMTIREKIAEQEDEWDDYDSDDDDKSMKIYKDL